MIQHLHFTITPRNAYQAGYCRYVRLSPEADVNIGDIVGLRGLNRFGVAEQSAYTVIEITEAGFILDRPLEGKIFCQRGWVITVMLS